LFFLGEFAAAREHWEQGIALYDRQQHRHYTALFGMDMGVFFTSWLPHALWYLGYPEQALSMSHKSLILAQELAHPVSLKFALDYTYCIYRRNFFGGK
jgi:hypothetical protein